MDENLSRGYIQLGKSPGLTELKERKGLGSVTPPEDTYNGIYLALILAGVGFLLPYNSFIIAVDYFQDKYPGTTVIFDMSMVYILMAFVAVLLNNLLVETLNLNIRITIGYVVSFFTLLFVTVCEIWLEMFDKSTSYTINLAAVAVTSMGCTIQQSSFYGYTSMLPSRYTQAVMAGESAAGLLISVNRIITKALLSDERQNTIIFFLLSLLIVLVCFVLHNVVKKTEFVLFYIKLCREGSDLDERRKITLEPSEDVGLVDVFEASGNKGKYGVRATSFANPVYDVQVTAEESQSSILELETMPVNSDKCFSNPNYEDNGDECRQTQYRVEDVTFRGTSSYGSSYSKSVRVIGGLRKGIEARIKVAQIIWPYMFAIAMAYFVTLSLFPGIESEIYSCGLQSWMPVLLMAIFNAFDFIGKVIASISYDWRKSQLMIFSCLRLLLIPLFVMCATPRDGPLISGEGWSMMLSLVLGVTNGVFGSVPMIIASTKVPDEYRELAGNIMTLSYSIGLSTGSGVSYLLNAFLGPSLEDPCAHKNFSQPIGTTRNPFVTDATTQVLPTVTLATSVFSKSVSEFLSTAVTEIIDSGFRAGNISGLNSTDFNTTFPSITKVA